ncbi:MAG: DUF4157 domain-containing protein [Deltaproteobacteria bacterium]|nr:DUF4157 domain-containing protein [Deltaproteobacteria bacterium]
MTRSHGTRPGIAVVGRARSSSEALADLTRRVAWMVARGWRPDTIERLIASWMREGGGGPDDAPRIARETTPGLSWRQMRLMARRLDGFARRPDPGPEHTEPLFEPRPWITRDPSWFASLRTRANDASVGLGRLGFERPERGPSHLGVHLRERVVSSPFMTGGFEATPRVAIPAGLAPGIYALQRRANDHLALDAGPSPQGVLGQLGAGRPLAPDLRGGLSDRMASLGRPLDLDSVIVHEGAAADRLCREMRAEAFAIGRHVVFSGGRLDAGDPAGIGLLAHELAHVWQQTHGLVAGADRVVSDPGLEADADRFGRAVAELGPLGRSRSAAQARPAPRAATLDGLVSETRAFVRSQRARPAAIFIVTDRITAYDADFKALGRWHVTGPCPLERGYWLDGGVGSAGWSTLSQADRARLTRGRADDLWVIGGRAQASTPALVSPDRDDLAAILTSAMRTARAPTDLGREVDQLLAALVGPTADGGLASATTPDVSIPRYEPGPAAAPRAREHAEVAAGVSDDDPLRAALTRSLAADVASQLGLSGLRVRVDEGARALTAARGTDGVAIDGTAYLDPRAFDPTTAAGRALLAHELVHVAQAALPRPAETGAVRAEAIAAAEAEALEAGRRFAAGGRLAPARRPLPAGHTATGLAEDKQVKDLFKDFFEVAGLVDAGGGTWTGQGAIAVGGELLKGSGDFALTAKLKENPGESVGWQRWEWAKAEKKIAPFGEEAGAILIESINAGSTPRIDVTVSFRDLEIPGLAPIPELDLKAQGVADGKALGDLSLKAKGQVDLDTSGLMGKLVQRAHVVDPSFDVGTKRLNATGEAVLKLPGIEANKGEFKIVDNVVSGTFDFESKRFGVPDAEPIVDGEVKGRITIADNKFAHATLRATTGVAIKGVPEDDDLVVWDIDVEGDGATDVRGKLTQPVTFAWVLPQSPIEDLVLSELDGQIVTGSEGGTTLKLHSRVDLLHSKTRLGAHVIDDNSFVFDYDNAASTKLTLGATDPLVVHLLGTDGPNKLDVVVEGLRFAGPSLKEGTLSWSSGTVTGKLPIAGRLDGALLQTDSLREINADLALATDIRLPSEDAPLLAGRADSALQVRKGALKEGKVGAALVMALPGGLEPVKLEAHLEVDERAAVSAGFEVTEPLVLVKDRLTLTQGRLDRAANGDLDGDLVFHVGPTDDGWDVSEKFDKSKGLTAPPAEAKKGKETTDAVSPYDYTLHVGFSLSQGFYAEGRFGANLGPLRIEGMGRISQMMLLGRGADLQFGFVGDLSKPLSFKKTLLKAPKKKIPIIAWGGLAGLFAEAGADIGVQAQAGSIGVDGGGTIQGLKPWGPFADKATAKVNVQGSAQGSIVGGPTLGIGAWVSGGLLSVSGGLRMPLTATLAANLSTSANIELTPGGVTGDVAVAAPLLFSMGGAAIPYFDFKALGGAIKSNKEGKPLAELTLVEPTKVLDFGVSLSDLLKPAEASAPAEIDTSAEVKLGDAGESVEEPPKKAVPSQGTVAPLTEAPTETASEDFDTTTLWKELEGSVGEEAWYKRVDTLRVLLEKVGSIISIATTQLDRFVKWLSDNVKLDLASVGDTFWSNIQTFTEEFSGSSALDVVKLVRMIWKGKDAEDGGEQSVSAVDLNGDLEALEGKLVELPGIGPAKAKAIKDHRVAVGRFKDKRELLDVPGIGAKTFEKIESLVVASAPEGEVEGPPSKLDLNAATAKDLEKIDGIGEKLAAAIVEYRKGLTDARFTTVEQLLGVPGIGPARLEKLKEAVQIGSEVGPDTSVSLGQLDLTMGSARLRAQVLSTQPLKVWFPAAANTLRDDLILQEFQGGELTGDADGVEGAIVGSLYTKGLGTFDGMRLPVSGKTVKPEFASVPFRKGELLADLPVPEALSGKLANLPNAVTEITIEQRPAGAELPATIGGVKLSTDKPISTIFDRPDGETWRLKGLDGIAFGGEDSYFMARLLDAEWAEQTGFSGSGELAARLGSVGAAAGQLTIKNNKLESVKLGLDSATIGFPKAAPLVTAQVMGHLEIGAEYDTSAELQVLATLPKLPSAPTVKAAIKFDKDWNPAWKAALEAPVSIMSGVTLLSLAFGESDKKFWASGAGMIDLAGVHIATSVSYAAESGLSFAVVGDVGVPGLELTSLSGGYGPGGLSLGGGARFTRIPGFEPLEASFSLSGKRVTFTTKPVEQKAEGARTKLKLTLQDFGYDMGTRAFTGAGGLEGILPMVGLVRGHFEIADAGEVKEAPPKPPPESSESSVAGPSTPEVPVEEGGFGERIKVTKGHLEVVNDRLRIPDAKPFVWGQIEASLDYEDGRVDGAMKAKGMRLELPGMGTRPLTLEASVVDNVYAGKVGLGPEAKKRPASWVTLKSFGGGYDGKKEDDPWSFDGAIGVSLGATETTLDVKYGAGALAASGTVDFGKKDPKSRFWGTVTASYDSGKSPTFGFSGSITAKLGDNLEGGATLAYNDKAGDPDNPGGVDLGLTLSPASIVDGRTSPTTLAGPYRLDFPLAAFPPVPITLFGSLGGQVDLDYGSKTGVSISGAADVKGIRRDPGEDGGLTFDSAEVRPKITGDLFAELAGGPSIGIGAALLLPKLASVQGTLGIPLKLTATATPTLEGSLRYKQGALDGGAAISAPLYMSAAIEPTLSLDTMLLGFPKKWGSIAIGKWPLMKPKKLFDFHYELGRLNEPPPALEAPKPGELEDAPSAPEPTNEATSVTEQKVEAKDAPPSGSLAGAQGSTFDLMGLKDKAVGKLQAVTEWIADKWTLVANLGKAVWNKAKEFASTCGNWLRVGAEYATRLGSWARFWRGGADRALEEAESSRYEIYNQPDLKEYEGFDEAAFLEDSTVQSKIGLKARQRYKDELSAMKEWDDYSWGFIPVGSVVRFFGSGGATHERQAKEQKKIAETAEETRQQYADPIARAKKAMEESTDLSAEMRAFYRFMIVAGRAPLPAALPVLIKGWETVAKQPAPVSDALMAMGESDIGWLFWSEGAEHDVAIAIEYLQTVEHRRGHWFQRYFLKAPKKQADGVERAFRSVSGFDAELRRHRAAMEKTRLSYDSSGHCKSSSEEVRVASFEEWALDKVEKILDQFDTLPKLAYDQEVFRRLIDDVRACSPGKEVMQIFLDLMPWVLDPESRGSWRARVATTKPLLAYLREASSGAAIWGVLARSEGSARLVRYLRDDERCEARHIRQAIEHLYPKDDEDNSGLAYWLRTPVLERFEAGITGVKREQTIAQGISSMVLTRFDDARDRFDALEEPTEEQRKFMAFAESMADLGVGTAVLGAIGLGASAVLSGGEGAWRKWAASRPLKAAMLTCTSGYDTLWGALQGSAGRKLVTYLKEYEGLGARDFRQILTAGGALKSSAATAVQGQVSGLEGEIESWKKAKGQHASEQIKSVDDIMDAFDEIESLSGKQLAFKTWLRIELEQKLGKGVLDKMISGARDVLDPEQASLAGPKVSYLYAKSDAGAVWDLVRTGGGGGELTALSEYCLKVEKSSTRFEELMLEMIPQFSTWSGRQKQAATNVYNRTGLGSMRSYM